MKKRSRTGYMCCERETGVKDHSRHLEGRVAGEDEELGLGRGKLKTPVRPMYSCRAGFTDLEFRKRIWPGDLRLGVTSLQTVFKATGPGGLTRGAGGHR